MKTIQLIQPEKSKGYVDNSRTGCYIPLGLVSIASYLKNKLPKIEIEILDGELISNKEIISHLIPSSIVGIETKTPNYSSALEVAYEAKKIGCTVVVGGVYASAIPNLIVKYRSHIIDHVIEGFGEKPMLDIVKGTNDKIIINRDADFNNLPSLNRNEFVNIEKYVQRFRHEHKTWNYRGTNIFTHMGCKYKCVFCSRQGPKGLYCRDPIQIWDEVTNLVQEDNIDYIVDFSDTITQNITWLENLIKFKPRNINPIFHVFSTADGIDNSSIKLFKKINVKHVFVGVETGDEALAKITLKGRNFSSDITLSAIEKLTEHNIGITPSFVLGLPGENRESLQNTYNYAKKIKKISGFEEIFCSALIPFPGSIAFTQLRNKIGGAFFDTDIYDPEALKKLWIKEFCNIDYKTIMEYVDRILNLGEYKITIRR